MGKIVLLVPREDMQQQAHNILQENRYHISDVRVITSENAVVEARREIAAGAQIIIARGLQASLIKQYTNIPVAEIVLTAQEMALLVTRAKQIVHKAQPVIAVVGFQNMFCDMSYFDEIYGVQLRTYFVKTGETLGQVSEFAAESGVDLIIGGDTTVEIAGRYGIPSLFLSATEDSLRQAFAVAERMEYAMEVEQKSAAQMETLLDYSYNGIIWLDQNGVITAVNPAMEEIIGESSEELKGQRLSELAIGLDEEVLRQVLEYGKENSVFLTWNHTSVFAVMAPVLFDNRVDGVIITCHNIRKNTRIDAPVQTQKESRGRKTALPPLVTFEDIIQNSREMKACIKQARLFAMSGQPIVLYGEPGTEKRMIAESIHNDSERSRGPFLDIPCEGLTGEEQHQTIFGERGAVMQAQGGTLLIQDVSELTPDNQYRLYQLIRFRVLHGAEIAQLRKVDVHVIVTSETPLAKLLQMRRIRKDLYYLLSGLELSVPPLRLRPEDLRYKIDETFRDCCKRYDRYHVLADEARTALLAFGWPGNLFQVESFFERLVLTAQKRTIDEMAVRALFEELYPDIGQTEASPVERESVAEGGAGRLRYRAEEAQKIADLLERFGGSREKTAEALGISKATLWRHMKKYGIPGKY